MSRSSLAAQRGGALVTAASLINVSDPDDDAITRYRFYDGTTGNGRFVLSGTPQVEGANIEITAGQLSSLQYGFGGGGTSDIIWAQAYDGYAWSTWASFTVAAVTNVAPIASVQNLAPGKGTTFIAGASLFTVTDPDDANMAKYRFFDGTAGNGCFQLNGDDQVELKNIEINASDLANFRFRTSTSGSDVLWVQAFNGTAWSAWKTFTVAAPANVAPTVNVQNLSPAHADAFISGVNLFTVSDPDDASMARFRFFDGTAGNGCFQLNGGDQVELKNIEINASDLVNFRYRTSATGAGDTLWVQAFDGTAWSAWKSFNVNAPANVAPVVSVQALNPTHGTAFIAGSALFTVSDPDDANMAKYRFFDGSAGNGRFQLNGQDRVELTNIEISASDLANFRYRTSATGTGDTLWVQAFDGTAWSAWKSFNVAAPPNNAPVVTVNQASLSPTRGTATIAASNFFSVSDADNDTITQFRFFDGNAGNGRFELNGDPQVDVPNITITATDLANFRDRTSTTGTGDTLWVQASDGTSWSAWKSFNVAAPQNNAPVVSVADRLGVVGFQAPASALFTASDADNDPIVAYQFWDSTPGQGHFEISGAAKGENQAIDVMANQLAATQFVVSNNEGSVELLWARASDGTSWGAWKSFTITAVSSLGGGSGSNNISFFGSKISSGV